jgi:hypothetical protein
MNHAHTPGPWEVWTDPGIETRDLSVGPVNGGIAVADIVTTNAHGIATADSISTGHANANLIAAAPDLLNALEGLMAGPDTREINGRFECAHCGRDYGYAGDEAPERCESDDCPAFIARAAIAKAKGGQ